MAGTVNSQARLEADLQRADLVGQRQLLVEARNSRCRPKAATRRDTQPVVRRPTSTIKCPAGR